jgi:hypothetical protein
MTYIPGFVVEVFVMPVVLAYSVLVHKLTWLGWRVAVKRASEVRNQDQTSLSPMDLIADRNLTCAIVAVEQHRTKAYHSLALG